MLVVLAYVRHACAHLQCTTGPNTHHARCPILCHFVIGEQQQRTVKFTPSGENRLLMLVGAAFRKMGWPGRKQVVACQTVRRQGATKSVSWPITPFRCSGAGPHGLRTEGGGAVESLACLEEVVES